MDSIAHDLFEKLNDVPKNDVVAEWYANRIAAYQMQITTAKAALQVHTAEVLEYESEVIKVICGDRKLNPDLLNKLYEDAKAKAAESEQTVKGLEMKIRNGEQVRDLLSQQFNAMKTQSNLYLFCCFLVCWKFTFTQKVLACPKSFIAGTYHGLGDIHLLAFLNEFCFRFNRRYWLDQLFAHTLYAWASARPFSRYALIR